MKNRTLSMFWQLLHPREKRRAFGVFVALAASSMFSAAVIGSIGPFLKILTSFENALTSPYVSWIYEILGMPEQREFVVAFGLFTITLIIIGNIVQILRLYLLSHFSMMRGHSISALLFKTYLGQSYEFFLERNTAEMARNILDESQQAVQQYLLPLAELVSSVLTIVAVAVMLFWVNPWITAVSIALLGGVYLVTYILSRKAILTAGSNRVAASGIKFKLTHEALGGIKNIKISHVETQYVERYVPVSKQMAKAQISIRMFSQSPRFFLEAAALSGVIGLCIISVSASGASGQQVIAELIPLIGVFAFAGQKLLPELQRAYSSIAQMRYGSVAVDNVYDGARLKGSIERYADVEDVSLEQSLELVDVSYRYPNSERKGINSLSLKIRAGERIGVIGSTGSGKSTFADIVLGLLRPQSGAIYADGRKLSKNNLAGWHRSVAYVPQEIFLSDQTILENIAFGVPSHEIDLPKAVHCAKISQLATLIDGELEQGYFTQVGEKGVRLSGGQKQRLGIARALYSDSSLVVLDEATSALDGKTESSVMRGIEGLSGEKTLIMIAHRLATLKACDRILMIEQGRLVGFDTWDNLSRNNAIFQKQLSYLN